MLKSADALDEHRFSAQVYDLLAKDIPKGLPPAIEAGRKLAAWNKAHGIKEDTPTPEQAVAGRIINENPKATGEELSTLFRDAGVQVGRQPERDRIISERVYYEEQAIRDREGREPTAAESAKIRETASATMGRAGAGAGGVPTMGKEQAQAVEETLKNNPGMSRTEAIEKVKRAASTPSGNRLDDLSSKIDQTDNIITGSEKQLDFLRTFKGGAGLMGKIMRGDEIASNIVGAGTQTERVEFRRRVHELQEMVPRIITDSNGRPLKSVQDKVDDFVAGLNAGDTGPNTIRAYEELIAEMQKRQADYRARRSGGFSPDAASSGAGAPAATATEKSGKDAPWLKDPVKGGEKRSAISGPVMSDADPEPVRAGAQYAQADVAGPDTRSLPTFSIDEIRSYRNKEIPPGSYPRVGVDNQEKRVIVDKSYGNLDEFGYKKIGELNRRYKLAPGEKVLLIDKQGHQFGYKRDDSYDGGFTFWMPYEEEPGS